MQKNGVMTGTVKWFKDHLGYGFIRAEGIPSDIMVHYVEIKMEGFKTLARGDVVNFRIQRTDKGLKATEVEVVEKTAVQS